MYYALAHNIVLNIIYLPEQVFHQDPLLDLPDQQFRMSKLCRRSWTAQKSSDHQK